MKREEADKILKEKVDAGKKLALYCQKVLKTIL